MNRAGIGLFATLGACWLLACGGTSDNGLIGDGLADAGGASGGGASGEAGSGGGAKPGDGGGGSAGDGGSGGSPQGGVTNTGGVAGTGGAPNTGGVSTGGSGMGGSGGTGLVSCTTSLDCSASTDGATICSAVLGVCVECAGTPDCPANNDCIRNACAPYQPCTTSLDCTLGDVCDGARGRCVGCMTTADCGANEVCSANACATACDSDNDCTPLGKLCNFGSGACVDCSTDGQCAAGEFCEAGACLPDVCVADASTCSSSGVVTCNPRGDGFLPPAPCGARESCVVGASGAACAPWVCTPDATECSDSVTRITCSADGFSITSTVDCSATGEFCSAGACGALVCQPDSNFCDQPANSVRHCASDGLSSAVTDPCSASEYCDAADATCKALLCTPNAPICDGSIATTCNATGTGYSAGGTDCANQQGGLSCANGVCAACNSTTALRDVRLVEVFVGADDYVILENTNSTCSVDLADLTLEARDAEGPSVSTISSFTLAPGARALVGEAGSTAPADALASQLIDLNYNAGYAMLCIGPCTTGATPTVVDVMAYTNGVATPPALPSPVTFSALSSTPSATMAFVRDAFTGTYPSFQVSDWASGTPTRPDSTSVCPVTQPTGVCTSIGSVCTYGAVTCACQFTGLTFGWICQ